MISRRLRPLLLIVCCLLRWLPSKEQTLTNGYSITHYNSDNALPQNSIAGMAFDKNGFLWLATQMGIVRFDGRNFREYNTQNSPALSWNEFSLSQQAPGTNRVYIKPTPDSSCILTVTDDYQIVTDSIISASPHHQLIAPNSHLFSYPGIYKTYVNKRKELLNKLATSHALVTVNERQAYFPDAGQCYFLDENARSITLLPEITGRKLALHFLVNDIYFYIDDQYRLLAFRNGVLQKNISCAGNLLQLLKAEAKADHDAEQTNLKIKRDGTHTMMVCNDTVLQLRIVNNILDYKILVADMPVKDIKCMIYEEDHQMLYVGSMTSGLYVLKLHEFERLFFNQPGFAGNSQASQIELPGERILTCTGVLNYTSKDHVPFPVTRSFDKHVLFQASDGAIWYSASDSLKKTDGRLRDFKSVKHLGYYLTGIIETGNKDLIYSNKHQVFRRTGSADTILVNDLGLARDEEITSLRIINNNILLIGTSAGLFSYDLLKSRADAGLRPVPGMEKKAVFVIHVAKDSSIWIGTYGQGFYKFHKHRFIRMPMDSRNALATAHCFMEDRQGYFWISSNKGLFRVAKKELDDYAAGLQTRVYYYYVDKSSGFSTNEFNACTPCGIETRDGWFSFPSIDGLVRFNPDSVAINLPDKPIIVEQVMADDKRSVVKDKLVASQHAGSLMFEISAPYFGNKFNLHLEYTIKEWNDKWYPVNEDGKLIITKLGKGEYTLVIRKQNPHAQDTYNTIHLTILPYWYEQIWFRSIVAALVIGAFLLFFRARYNYQVKRAQLLQQKVEERTGQLSESNRVKELMISAILHDLRSPLRYLHILARRMYDNHKTSPDKELSQILFQFENATNEIYDFTQDFFVFANMQKEGFVINRERIVLRGIVSEIISLCEVGATIQKNTFSNLVPEHITLDTDANLLSLVLRNLADNANKYTSGGAITIEAITDAFTTRIIMTDAGDSMDKELIARILDKSYKPSQHGMGWGYKIILEILGKLEGTLDIVSGIDQGNIITITFENKG